MGEKEKSKLAPMPPKDRRCPKCGSWIYSLGDIESMSIEKRVGQFLHEVSKNNDKLDYRRIRNWYRYACVCGWRSRWKKFAETEKGKIPQSGDWERVASWRDKYAT